MSRQDPPQTRIRHWLAEACKAQEYSCYQALCVYRRSRSPPPYSYAKGKLGPRGAVHQPNPLAIHKIWRLQSSLFSRRIQAVRRRLSAEGKPTLYLLFKEEIYKDVNRSSILLPRLGTYLPFGKSLLKNPLAISLQVQRALTAAAPAPHLLSSSLALLHAQPWPDTGRRHAEVRGLTISQDKNRISNYWKKQLGLLQSKLIS